MVIVNETKKFLNGNYKASTVSNFAVPPYVTLKPLFLLPHAHTNPLQRDGIRPTTIPSKSVQSAQRENDFFS